MPETSTKQGFTTRDVKAKADEAEDCKHDHNPINVEKKSIATSHNRDTKQRHERPNFSHQHRQLATSTSIFVTGFAHSINKTHVERLFSKFGTTERISEFMTSQKSASASRYCFVEYDSIESAQKAMDNLHGRTLLRKRLAVLPAHANTEDTSSGRNTAPLNPKKERILIDQKITALKKKIKESQSD